MNIKLLYTGLFFLFILASGFWLSRSGRPINSAILTVHKLIGLAAGVYLIVTVTRLHQQIPLSGSQVLALGFTVAVFLALVATGGLLSTEKTWPGVVTILHHVLPYLAILSTGGTLYLLLSGT
jgi:hypothetical protein